MLIGPFYLSIGQTLTLFECEKHPGERDWEETAVADRILGILLQVSVKCTLTIPFYLGYLDWTIKA